MPNGAVNFPSPPFRGEGEGVRAVRRGRVRWVRPAPWNPPPRIKSGAGSHPDPRDPATVQGGRRGGELESRMLVLPFRSGYSGPAVASCLLRTGGLPGRLLFDDSPARPGAK